MRGVRGQNGKVQRGTAVGQQETKRRLKFFTGVHTDVACFLSFSRFPDIMTKILKPDGVLYLRFGSRRSRRVRIDQQLVL